MVMKMREQSGQMSIEFMLVLPVIIIIAVIAVNALLFFSECAAFDRLVRDAVRVHATSPAYGQGLEQSCSQIAEAVSQNFEEENLVTTVNCEQNALGNATFTAEIIFSPTLFGMGMRSSVLGVPLPSLKHSVSFTVSPYKPGVLL